MKRRLLGGFLVLLAALGCGRQDRYEITSPPQLSIGTEGPQRSVQAYLPPAFGYTDTKAAYLDGELLLGADNGQIFRVLEGGYAPLVEMPGELGGIRSMRVGPDGTLWILDSDNEELWSWDGATWSVRPTPPTGWFFDGMLCDPLGRVLLWEDSVGLYALGEDGAWNLEISSAVVSIRADWQLPDGGVALLGARLELIQWTDEGWEIGPPRLEESVPLTPLLATDEQGHWAIIWYQNGQDNLLADGGQGEELIPLPSRMNHVFWWNGSLHGFDEADDTIERWDGEAWTRVHAMPTTAGHWYDLDLMALPHGYLLVFARGETVLLDDSGVSLVNPYLDNVHGGAFLDGQPHILSAEGYHLRLRDGAWEFLGAPLVEQGLIRKGESLLAAPDGGLLVLGTSTSYKWDPSSGYVLLPQSDIFNRSFLQNDGTILIVGNSRLWLYSSAGIEDLGSSQGIEYSVNGAILLADQRVLISHSDYLAILENGSLRILEHHLDGDAQGLVEWPGQGYFRYGVDRFVSVLADEYQDLTPVWDLDGDILEVQLVEALPDGQGGVLALDIRTGRVARLENGVWEAVESTVWYRMGKPTNLRRTPDGTLFFFDERGLGRFLEVGP